MKRKLKRGRPSVIDGPVKIITMHIGKDMDELMAEIAKAERRTKPGQVRHVLEEFIEKYFEKAA